MIVRHSYLLSIALLSHVQRLPGAAARSMIPRKASQALSQGTRLSACATSGYTPIRVALTQAPLALKSQGEDW
ncbi:hypothetical protein BDW71DRAFT_179281 [Aspergillus fruticulosus]